MWISGTISHRLSHRISCEAREPSLLGTAETSEVPFGCPTGFEEAMNIAIKPESGTDVGDEPGEAMGPTALPGYEPQEKMNEQGGPDLPLHGVGRVAKEVDQLDRLLNLLRKCLHGPAASVKLADGRSCPLGVVGKEDHDALFAVDLDERGDPSQETRIVLAGIVSLKHDQFILEDALVRGLGQALLHPACHVVLGAGDEEDAPLHERPEVPEVDVRFVENHDFSLEEAGAQLPGPRVVVLTGRVHDRKARQEALEVQPQMALRSRLAPAVFRPAHARGHQLDRRRVHRVDRTAEPPGYPAFPAASNKRGTRRLQVPEHGAEQLLGHRAVPHLVRMAERVLGWRPCSPNAEERTGAQPQGVADVVQAQRMADLRVQHRDHVAPRTVRSALFINARFPRRLRHEVRRNQLAYLAQTRKLTSVRLFRVLFIHTLPCGRSKALSRTAFFSRKSRNPVGRQ